MTPTADDFRALARSSPWRWTTLHFLRRSRPGDRRVEAWLRRPDQLLVRDDLGSRRHDGWPYGTSATDDGIWPTDVEPGRRPDGLVERRPDDWRIRWGDPMYASYDWVAMLDPVELSHDVEIRDVRRGERCGRPTWEAQLRPLDGYDPRCSCCPLLWSEVSDRYEYDDGSGSWSPTASYADAYDVALDVETAVAVRVEDLGGDRAGVTCEVEILEVDADLDALLG